MIADRVPVFVGYEAIDPSREAYFIHQNNTPAP